MYILNLRMGLLPAKVLSQFEMGSTYDVVLDRLAMNVWYAVSYAQILQLFDPIHKHLLWRVLNPSLPSVPRERNWKYLSINIPTN